MSTSAGLSSRPVALPAAARAWRVLLTLAIAGLTVSGTLWGFDDWWPFAPMKMYATSTDPDGLVSVLTIEVRGGSGRWVPANLSPGTVGVNRAEVEGQLPRLVAHPELLHDLARTHARLSPHDVPWTGVRIVSVATVLRGGAPTGEVRHRVVAHWSAP